jgi:hypothetical protein
MRWIIMAIIASCSSPVREQRRTTSDAAPGAPATAAASNIDPGRGRSIAVVELGQVFEECSGAGGTHAAMHLANGEVAHVGGHAMHLPFAGPFGRGNPAGGIFVAELLPISRPDEDHDGNPDSSVSGWCLDGMPQFDAEIIRLWPAPDRAAAERLVAVAGASSIELDPAASARIGVARVVTANDVVGKQATTFTLETITGDAPASFEAPWPTTDNPFRPWVGDIVVVGTTASGKPVRVLVARDRRDAESRAAALKAGWPAIGKPIWESWFAAQIAPETLLGDVITGRNGCGNDVIVPPRPPDAALRRAAAPAGARPGDRLSLVVEPTTPDACGRTLRVVRAYVTPDAHDTHWLANGPPPARRLVE